MKTNLEANKRQLQQRKFKRFSYLKHKTQSTKDQTVAITQANFKKSCTNIINSNVHYMRKPSKTNIHQESSTFLKKLELLHPAHRHTTGGKHQQESLPAQSKNQPTEIKELKI